jgi:Protein of unknown function (DUF1822)
MINSTFLKIDLPKHLFANTSSLKDDRQVYLNSLALYAADWYLKCLQFETQHEDQSDWWMQYLSKSAALEVAGIGKLECIPVVGDAATITLSPDLKDDRVGYLFVKLNESLTSAEIMGFMPKYSETVRLDRLESTDKLIDYLCDLELEPKPIITSPSPIDLLEGWGLGIFNGIWKAIDELSLTPAYRSRRSLLSLKSTGGGGRIKLGNLPESPTVIVTIEYQQVDDVNFNLYLQIYPESPELTLPIDLKFSAVSDGIEIDSIYTKADNVSGEIVLENGKKGESFNLEVEFNGIKQIQLVIV